MAEAKGKKRTYKNDGKLASESGEMSTQLDTGKKKHKAADNQLTNLRQELSGLPLGELLLLKDHMPAKLYKKAVLHKVHDDPSHDSPPEMDSSDEEPEEQSSNPGGSRRDFKRDNRKRPREMSAKKPVSVIRDIFATKKRAIRDPRFDDKSGQFNPSLFNREYSFLNDLKKDEYNTLRKNMKEESDPKRLEKLKLLKQRMENQWKSEKEEMRKKELVHEARRTNMERMKQGKDPFYVKKAELKRRLQDERLERLEKEGKLKKYQERTEKKLARKDRLKMPSIE